MILKFLIRIFVAANVALLAICAYSVAPNYQAPQSAVATAGH